MKRLLTAIISLAVMTTCFAGCGAKEDAGSKTKNESSTSQSLTKTDETSEETREETVEEEKGGLEKTHYRDDGSYYIEEYDMKGNMIKVTDFKKDGTIEKWLEYECDSAGKRTKTTHYRADGTIERIQEYDTNENILIYQLTLEL